MAYRLCCCAILLVLVSLSQSKTLWHQLDNYDFEDYVVEFHRVYETTEEYNLRKDIFQKKLNEIKEHNADNTKTWKMGVNKFTDYTQAEFEQLLGLNKGLLHLQKLQYKQQLTHDGDKIFKRRFNVSDLPSVVDWRQKGIITPVKDQGHCGSCWTFGTAETIESYWAVKTGLLEELSEQQIVDCTPNPQKCGGTGGCNGGTAQLAMDRIVVMKGLSSEWTYPYVSYSGKVQQDCKYESNNNITTDPVANITGYVRLPENNQDALLEAVATIGPQIINVDASTWSLYESGIFNGCNQVNPDVNHVVQLVGYGPGYWLVRNSWSPLWGEQGYIRLLRSDTVPCGTDLHPQDGDICEGGPTTVEVCGTCGVVYDSTYPTM